MTPDPRIAAVVNVLTAAAVIQKDSWGEAFSPEDGLRFASDLLTEVDAVDPLRQPDVTATSDERSAPPPGRGCPVTPDALTIEGDELKPSIRRAAQRAADREWAWSNPRCPICERHHPPDECDAPDTAASTTANPRS